MARTIQVKSLRTCIIMCCLGLFYGCYQNWYALHDSLWTDIEAAELAMHRRQYGAAHARLLAALDKVVTFESQRIPVPIGRHRDTVIRCLGDLGHLHKLQGKYPEAIEFYKLRLDRSERLLGKNSYWTNLCLTALMDLRTSHSNPH